MINLVYHVSKTNISRAICLACLFAVLSNVFYGWLACLVLSDATAQTVNTMIDVLQLALYCGVKLYRFKRLDRYDLPFIIGGSLAIML
ncbi:hypothetical protein [Staphylococcus haemolyticus]|uniref:hypothetical protein n=1 Tax=Staphylococcus haemolyticus TaxID=1283 RepID=UPI001E2A1041|nr:hypothetical protein [Staphylococcus haemolyticus]MCC3724042.1 hypothetical protein [Staphylococcus haemolyticus]